MLLDGAVPSLALSEAESGLGLTVRCGPAGAVYDPDVFTDVMLGASRRGLVCLRAGSCQRASATPAAAT